MAGVAEM